MRITTITAIVILMLGPAASRGTRATISSSKLPEHTLIQQTPAANPLRESFEIALVQASNRCYTQYFWCYLPGYAPVGTSCWCPTPNGPVAGVVR
jgi:hypothetical protein